MVSHEDTFVRVSLKELCLDPKEEGTSQDAEVLSLLDLFCVTELQPIWF